MLVWIMLCFLYFKGGFLVWCVGVEMCWLFLFIIGDVYVEGVWESLRGEKDILLMCFFDVGLGWVLSLSWILMSFLLEFFMVEGRDGFSDLFFGLIGGVLDFGFRGLFVFVVEFWECMIFCGR